MKKYSFITLCSLFFCSLTFASLGQLVNAPNPFGQTPSDPVSWLPGFTEQNILIIAAASDLNQGALPNISYQNALSFMECKAHWSAFVKQATKAPEGQFYFDYVALSQNNRAHDKELEVVLFVRKLEKALRRMLGHHNNFCGFYNAKKLYRLKLSMAQAMDIMLKKDPKNIALWLPVVQKLGMNVIAYENALLHLGMLDYNSHWEKRKEATAASAYPLTKSLKALGKLGGQLDPRTAGREPEQSQALQSFFEQKHAKLQQKLKLLITTLKKKTKKPNDWVETVSNDPEIFARPGCYLIPLHPDETTKARPAKSSLTPFGLICSAPSPIPGISWRRLAEVCTSTKQTLHAQDFSSVIDWSSFFTYMMQDKEAASYQESLFARFLKVYAPQTFLNVFSTKNFKDSDQTDFLLIENIQKTQYDLIMGIILNLEKPHSAYKRYSYRNALTALEAKLLRTLLGLYKHPERDAFVQFPTVVFALRDQHRPLKLKYAPDNLGLRFNTSNVDLYKAVVNLIKLNYIETSSGAINLHSGWSKTAALTKAPAYILTAPLTAPVRALEKGLSTAQARIMRTAAAVQPKRTQLRSKIKNALDALKKTPTAKAFKKYVGLKKTSYAAYKPKSTTMVIAAPDKAKPLPLSSNAHVPATLDKKKGIQTVYPINVPLDPVETTDTIPELETRADPVPSKPDIRTSALPGEATPLPLSSSPHAPATPDKQRVMPAVYPTKVPLDRVEREHTTEELKIEMGAEAAAAA